MNYITTTDLKTRSSLLVKILKRGNMISLVHRLKIIGQISPIKEDAKIFDVERFSEFVKTAKSLSKLTHKDRSLIYRQHLKKRYGRDIS